MVTRKFPAEEFRPVFVVGNSRSGTTMVGRILGRHPAIFTFHELHFFEQLWSPTDATKLLSQSDALQLCARLLSIQRDGYLKQKNTAHFLEEARAVYCRGLEEQATSSGVFERFLSYEAFENGKQIPCDQTPRNVFYIEEILCAYPHASVINMVRDPRDVLLSQKRKWKRRFLGARNIPLREAIRARINYHPIMISKLWNASVRAADKFRSERRVHTVAFEDLLAHSQERVHEICGFLGLPFQEEMLEVPQIGSSNLQDDPNKLGVNPDMASSWRKSNGLSPEEVYWCQKICGDTMQQHKYLLSQVSPSMSRLILSFMMFPLQAIAALLVNMKRMRNIFSAVRKRLN